MRVYISVDMEGVAGVVHEDQTDPTDPRHAGEYNRFRRLMTAEANAAIEGALAAMRSCHTERNCHPERSEGSTPPVSDRGVVPETRRQDPSVAALSRDDSSLRDDSSAPSYAGIGICSLFRTSHCSNDCSSGFRLRVNSRSRTPRK
jgi:hypothetical protein